MCGQCSREQIWRACAGLREPGQFERLLNLGACNLGNGMILGASKLSDLLQVWEVVKGVGRPSPKTECHRTRDGHEHHPCLRIR